MRRRRYFRLKEREERGERRREQLFSAVGDMLLETGRKSLFLVRMLMLQINSTVEVEI